MKENETIIDLVIMSGNDFLDIFQGAFLGYPIDRSTIKEMFRQWRNVDTNKWQYFTNDNGAVLLNV